MRTWNRILSAALLGSALIACSAAAQQAADSQPAAQPTASDATQTAQPTQPATSAPTAAPTPATPPAAAAPAPASNAAPVTTAPAALPTTVAPTTMDQVVNLFIEREHGLIKMLSNRTPVVETYLQNLTNDPQLGPIPNEDHYFLSLIHI